MEHRGLASLILFICFYREGKGGKKRRRDTSVHVYLSRDTYWGPRLQPRHTTWLGIEPATLWFAGRHSIHWATSARVASLIWSSQRLLLVKHFLFKGVAPLPSSGLHCFFCTRSLLLFLFLTFCNVLLSFGWMFLLLVICGCSWICGLQIISNLKN